MPQLLSVNMLMMMYNELVERLKVAVMYGFVNFEDFVSLMVCYSCVLRTAFPNVILNDGMASGFEYLDVFTGSRHQMRIMQLLGRNPGHTAVNAAISGCLCGSSDVSKMPEKCLDKRDNSTELVFFGGSSEEWITVIGEGDLEVSTSVRQIEKATIQIELALAKRCISEDDFISLLTSISCCIRAQCEVVDFNKYLRPGFCYVSMLEGNLHILEIVKILGLYPKLRSIMASRRGCLCGKWRVDLTVTRSGDLLHVGSPLSSAIATSSRLISDLTDNDFDLLVGSPETVILDGEDFDSVVTPKPLNPRIEDWREGQKQSDNLVNDLLERMTSFSMNDERCGSSSQSAKSGSRQKEGLARTIKPDDSASNISPVLVNWMNSQIASVKKDYEGKLMRAESRIGNYTKTEFEMDLNDALVGSGVECVSGRWMIEQTPRTMDCDLVPQITIDNRLNFLIRVHTALFKMFVNDETYPPSGLVDVFERLHQGTLRMDHPSFDLLQIVMEDTIDWRHMIVKNNHFLLPLLEPGVQVNERIVALCLKSMKSDYEIRWHSLVKDCVLPFGMLDSSRWSDGSSGMARNTAASRRPDLAIKDRLHQERGYTRRRKRRS
jgi:hypothetical protein